MRQFNLSEYLKNPHLKLCDRLGRKVTHTITIKDGNGIIYMAPDPRRPNGWYPRAVNTDGRVKENKNYYCDLMFADEPHSGWIVLYKDTIDSVNTKSSVNIFPTKKLALQAAKVMKSDIVIVGYKRINWTE